MSCIRRTDFSSTPLRRAATCLAVGSLVTLIGLLALLCASQGFAPLKNRALGLGLLGAATFFVGYSLSHIFLSKNYWGEEKHSRPKRAALCFTAAILVTALIFLLVAKATGNTFSSLIQHPTAHTILIAGGGVLLGGTLGYVLSEYKLTAAMLAARDTSAVVGGVVPPDDSDTDG